MSWMIVILGEIHSSKNSRRVLRAGNRVIVAKSKSAKSDESMLAEQLVLQAQEWSRMAEGRGFPFYVAFHFVRATKRKWDFANLVQGVADAIVKAGYIPDDDVNHFVPVYAGWTVEKERAGVEFWIQ